MYGLTCPGPIATVPYFAPGSEALSAAVVAKVATHDLILLRNHGPVVVGKDIDDVIQKAIFFELACRILIQCPSVTTLSRKAVAALRARRLEINYGTD